MPYDRNHPNRRRHVSYIQLKHLYELLCEHRDIAVGENKSEEARKKKNQLWQKVTPILNNIDKGNAVKTPSGWAKLLPKLILTVGHTMHYLFEMCTVCVMDDVVHDVMWYTSVNYWNDLKAKINRKVRLSQEVDENGSLTELELTDVQVKLLSILDPNYASNYPNMRVISLDPSFISSDDENKSDTDIDHMRIIKRQRVSQSNEEDYNMIDESLISAKKVNNDEYTAFGIHIANQLRNLSSIELYINAQDEIQTLITRYRLEDLKKNTEFNNDMIIKCNGTSPKYYNDNDEE